MAEPKVPSPLPGNSCNCSARSPRVRAASAGDWHAWAVGAEPNPSQYLSSTLAGHWNGTRWSIIPTPPISAPTVHLNEWLFLSLQEKQDDLRICAAGLGRSTPACSSIGFSDNITKI